MAKHSKITRQRGAAYLYSDGTFVEVFDEQRLGAKIGETIEITRGYAETEFRSPFSGGGMATEDATVPNTGRIVFHRYGTEGVLNILKGSRVTARIPSLHNGSARTLEQGIEIGYITITHPKLGEFLWYTLPGLLSAAMEIQWGEKYVASRENWQVGDRWGDAPVVAVTDLRKKEATA